MSFDESKIARMADHRATSRYTSARKLRVANVAYLNTIPYRSTGLLDWVQYTEAAPTECSRMLAEGEADLALLPLADAICYGGYKFLRYGVVAHGTFESVLLLSQRPLEELRYILLDTASQTSVTLLRVLLAEFFPKVSADIIFRREHPQTIVQTIGGATAGLLIGDIALKSRNSFDVCIDLAECWKRHTGHSFVFAFWAGREKSFDGPTIQKLERAFTLGLQKREFYAREWADTLGVDRDEAVRYVTQRVSYEVDDETVAGAQEFVIRASNLGLIPKSPIAFMTHAPFSKLAGAIGSPSFSTEKITDIEPASSLLAQYPKRRLSVVEANSLVDSTGFLDLALATLPKEIEPAAENPETEILEISHTNVCSIRSAFSGPYVSVGHVDSYLLSRSELQRLLSRIRPHHKITIRVTGGIHPELTLNYFEELVGLIRSELLKIGASATLVALSADEIQLLAQTDRRDPLDVLTALRRAGLDVLGGGTPYLLIDRLRRRFGREFISANDWLNIHRQAHELGIPSECQFPVHTGDSWEDRLLHLNKIRRLQDETGGVSGVLVEPTEFSRSSIPKQGTTAQEFLTCVAIARIFLNNIPRISSSAIGYGTPIAEASLQFGAQNYPVVLNVG